MMGSKQLQPFRVIGNLEVIAMKRYPKGLKNCSLKTRCSLVSSPGHFKGYGQHTLDPANMAACKLTNIIQ